MFMFSHCVKSAPIYAVISGPYFHVFGLNTGKYGPEITPYWTLFTQWVICVTCKSQQILTNNLINVTHNTNTFDCFKGNFHLWKYQLLENLHVNEMAWYFCYK